MWVTTRRRILFAPICLTAARISSTDSSVFMPQSSRSASSPSGKRNTLTCPSSNGIGKRSSNTLAATSVGPSSVFTSPAFSLTGLRWVISYGIQQPAFPRLTAQEEPMSEVKYSPEQIVEALPKYLVPEKAGATKATIQFDISGDDGGKWWVKIMTGEMDGMSAFMSRKLQVKGDMGLAVKLQTLFKRPS